MTDEEFDQMLIDDARGKLHLWRNSGLDTPLRPSTITADDDEFMLKWATERIFADSPGKIYEIRKDGKTLHRLEVQVIYTVNPKDEAVW